MALASKISLGAALPLAGCLSFVASSSCWGTVQTLQKPSLPPGQFSYSSGLGYGRILLSSCGVGGRASFVGLLQGGCEFLGYSVFFMDVGAEQVSSGCL